MTFRVTPSNVLDVVRNLVDDLDLLKRQTGTVKQNTIRLGDWVLEAVDDSLVKMTNLVTGEESYIGGVGDGGGTIINTVTEFPPFSIGGVVRIAFSSPVQTNVYVVPSPITITKIIATLGVLGTVPGPVFDILLNGTIVFTSDPLSALLTEFPVALDFSEDDQVRMQVSDTGSQDAIGLSVMLRS